MLKLLGAWLTNLVGSGAAALALYASVREIGHFAADSRVAFLGGLVPITSVKFPWVILLVVTLAALWFVTRRKGRGRGAMWGLWIWGLQLGISWSIAALLLWVGTVVRGLSEQSLSDLNWRFALGYLVTAVVLLAVCLTGWRVTNRRQAPG